MEYHTFRENTAKINVHAKLGTRSHTLIYLNLQNASRCDANFEFLKIMLNVFHTSVEIVAFYVVGDFRHYRLGFSVLYPKSEF